MLCASAKRIRISRAQHDPSMIPLFAPLYGDARGQTARLVPSMRWNMMQGPI